MTETRQFTPDQLEEIGVPFECDTDKVHQENAATLARVRSVMAEAHGSRWAAMGWGPQLQAALDQPAVDTEPGNPAVARQINSVQEDER